MSAPHLRPPRTLVSEPTLVSHFAVHGWPFELYQGDSVEAEAQARQALTLLSTRGMPHVDTPSGRLFDPAVALQWMKQEGGAGRDPMLRERCVPAARRLLDEASNAGECRVVLRRQILADSTRRVRLPLPIAPATIESVEPEGDAVVRFGDSFVDVRFAEPARSHAATVTFTTPSRVHTVHSTQATADREAARTHWLGHDEGTIRATPAVRALAPDALIGSTHEQVCALIRALFRHVAVGPIAYESLSDSDPLGDAIRRGWVDCFVGSALAVALCRIHLIPARIVGGWLLYPTASSPHYWLEAFDDGAGWRPYDLLGWDLAGGDLDDPHLGILFGEVWGRVATQIFPHVVTGPVGAQIPPNWRLIQRGVDGATESTLVIPGEGDDEARPVVRDLIRVASL